MDAEGGGGVVLWGGGEGGVSVLTWLDHLHLSSMRCKINKEVYLSTTG